MIYSEPIIDLVVDLLRSLDLDSLEAQLAYHKKVLSMTSEARYQANLTLQAMQAQ